MKMNLTGLAELGAAFTGQPLIVPLTDIRPDPNQPRTVFLPNDMKEIAESIRTRGVKTPISVRPDPEGICKYIINWGERRYLGSKMAGKLDIPVFFSEDCNSYDQVIENLQRADLTPMELARFIQGRLDAGDTKAAIARGIGKAGVGKHTDASFITHHLALIRPPACLERAYSAGVTSPRTLYELRALHDKHPEQVDAWCAQGAEITRPAIARMAERLGRDRTSNVQRQHQLVEPVGDEEGSFVRPATEASTNLDYNQGMKRRPKLSSAPAHALSPHKAPSPTAVIMVEHEGRRATVQRNSIVKIIYEGSNEVIEVALSDTVVIQTLEAPN
jgi:ParB family chromosome partitioning protein